LCGVLPLQGTKFWLIKGGDTGLLANLWQFPMAAVVSEELYDDKQRVSF